MSAEVGTLLARYTRLLLVGGLLVGFAAQAMDAIVGTTSEAGRHAHAIAATAAEQLGAVGGLSEQFQRVAEGSARSRIEIDELARRAEETAAGQAELERAIHQLGEVAADLQRVARHFAVET